MLRAIFQELVVDVTERRLVSIRPWPPFIPLLEMDGLTQKEGCFYVEKGSEGDNQT